MSSQPSLITVSADAKVKRPGGSGIQRQFFRRPGVQGSGVYCAMDENGNVEIIGGPGASGGSSLLEVRVPLNSLQIRNGNSSPILAVPSPGPGKSTEVVSAVIGETQGSVQFNGDDGSGRFALTITTDTANDYQYWDADAISLDGGVYGLNSTYYVKMLVGGAGNGGIFPTNGSILENKSLLIKATADSTLGDGSAVAYILYRIITI